MKFSRVPIRRIAIVFSFLIGFLLIAEVSKGWFLPDAGRAFSYIYTVGIALTGVFIGIWLDARGQRNLPPEKTSLPVETNLQVELKNIQEQLATARESHHQEMSRLTGDLAKLVAEKEKMESTLAASAEFQEQIQAYQDLERIVNDRTRELSAVIEVSKKIASTLELEPLLNLILDQIESMIPYSGAAIFSLENDILRVSAYQIPGHFTPYRALTLPLGQASVFEPVIVEKQVMILDDVKGESPLALAFRCSVSQFDAAQFSHARAWLGLPLVIHDRVMGMLSLTHRTPGFYTKNHARLAQTITNQVAMALENARLYEKAHNLATLEERNRIARELHDSVTQLLYGISLYCTATSRSLHSQNYSQVEENLIEIKENALQALREMRLLILELNPPMLQKEGLVAALEASLGVIESRTGLETQLITDGIYQLPSSIEPGLYRIAMEALNNLVRYARAQKVTVELQIVSNWIFLEIGDNGIGFDLSEAKSSGGMGIHNMEQRAQQLGGRLEIHSSPGSGTRIRAEIPIK